MAHKKGDRVKHPTRGDWGLGEVLEDSVSGNTRVFFVGSGAKVISDQYVSLQPVVGSAAKHPVLDNLHLSKAPGIKYRSLPDSIQYFLEQYPGGFHGDRFLQEERNYKAAAHETAISLLNESEFRGLCAIGEHAETCARAQKVVNATNLIFPNEKMAFRDGIKSPDRQQAFAEGLFEALYGSEELEDRFEKYSKLLGHFGADKWTTATYFQFILFPEEFMFVKPTVTQNAAAVSGFEIYYKSQLNWVTYKQVLAFSQYLRRELSELKPRDLIDVQSFMWCIASE